MIRNGKHGNKIYKGMSLCLCMMMALTGCQGYKTSSDAPELIVPKVMNESFRPVGYSDVGNTECHEGVVVPTEYPCFWDNAARVDEIYVHIGDYVKEGDALAKADVEEMEETVKGIEREKEYFIQSHCQDAAIYEWKLRELGYRKSGYEIMEDIPGMDQTELEFGILKENRRYEELFYQYRLLQFDKKIKEYKEDIDDAVLRAPKSGYVTFVKDVSEMDRVGADEIVAIVADHTDTYVQLTNDTIEYNLCDRFDYFYTMIGGQRYEMEEYEYREHEKLAAERKGIYPKVRMKFVDEGKKPEIGQSVPVFTSKDVTFDVLCVAKDSLYEDEKGYYVYVKTEEGKEIRYITIGKKDRQCVQVLSGLSEGEEVFYSSEAVAPSDYKVHTVSMGEYKDVRETEVVITVSTQKKILYSGYEGKLVEIVKDDNEEVKKGDVICKIKINEGSAYLADMRNQMEKAKKAHEDQIKAIDDMVATLSESRPETVSNTIETTMMDGQVEVETEYFLRPYLADEISCQMEAEKCRKDQMIKAYAIQEKTQKIAYEKASKNNDGTGIISILADRDGIVKDMDSSVGKAFKVGDEICKIETEVPRYVEAQIPGSIYLNQEVRFIDEGIEEVYTGKVIGVGGSAAAEKVFVTTTADRVVVNSPVPTDLGVFAYVTPDSEEYYTKKSLDGDKYMQFAAKKITDVYILPAGVVQEEELLKEEESIYYVWKIDGDRLIKQYVKYLYSAVDEEGIRVDCVVSGIEVGDNLAVTENTNLESAKTE